MLEAAESRADREDYWWGLAICWSEAVGTHVVHVTDELASRLRFVSWGPGAQAAMDALRRAAGS
jgi:hypothetical protein